VRLSARVHGRSFRFATVRDVLARASEPTAGDVAAGVAAASHLERAAAKCVLAELTLADLRAHPVLPAAADAVTRAVDAAVHEPSWAEIRDRTVGELRDWILADTTSAEQVRRVGRALTGEMAAAVAKLSSNLDLTYAARRMPVATRARTTVGLRGRLATHLRASHPRDDPRGISATIFEGLAYGCGDALIGIDPSADDPAAVAALLGQVHDLITRLRLPTQSCVRASAASQLRALEHGAPMDLFHHNLAGSEAALTALGTSLAALDDARALVHERGTLRGTQVLCLAAGRATEARASADRTADLGTLAARALALARRYNPFLVETVTGAGPGALADGRQMIRAALEDHFVGKLLGVPLGADACYTADGDTDHNDCDTLAGALAAAGASTLAVAPGGVDATSARQSPSFHDAAALRQTLGLRPAPEFEAWMVEHGLMADGRLTGRAGDPGLFMRG